MNDNTTLQKVIALLEETLETLCLEGNHKDTVWLNHHTTVADQLGVILGVARDVPPAKDNQQTAYLPGETWAISKVLDKEIPATNPDWKIWKNIKELVPLSEITGSVRKIINMDGVEQVFPSKVRVQMGWFLALMGPQSYLFQVPLSAAFAADYVANTALVGWIAGDPVLCQKHLMGSVEARDEVCAFLERYNKTLGVSVTVLPEITGLYNDLVLTHVLG